MTAHRGHQVCALGVCSLPERVRRPVVPSPRFANKCQRVSERVSGDVVRGEESYGGGRAVPPAAADQVWTPARGEMRAPCPLERIGPRTVTCPKSSSCVCLLIYGHRTSAPDDRFPMHATGPYRSRRCAIPCSAPNKPSRIAHPPRGQRFVTYVKGSSTSPCRRRTFGPATYDSFDSCEVALSQSSRSV